VTGDRVLAIVPAHNEESTVAQTVSALQTLSPLAEIVVVDDGSRDRTAALARETGARVFVIGRDIGKGGAVEGALFRLDPADIYLFADADLGQSAGNLQPVLDEVLEGRTDLAIAKLPEQGSGGGFGIVKRRSAREIERRTGWKPEAPLSGQRAITAKALSACRPIEAGFGMETAMTIDVLGAGFRVMEVPVDVFHRPPGKSPAGIVHRARQGVHIRRALAAATLQSREGRDELLRGFRGATYSFDIVMDIGAYRDLHRHLGGGSGRSRPDRYPIISICR
jgi:glycosyltransferase involved in cell wall biosynthesis